MLIKVGFLYGILNNIQSEVEFYKQAYQKLISEVAYILKIASIWEIKAVADTLAVKIALYALSIGAANDVINLFCKHYSFYKQSLMHLDKKYFFLVFKAIIFIGI